MENKEMNYLVKQNTNGVVMTSSRRIAEVFGKEHKNVVMLVYIGIQVEINGVQY